MFLEDREATDKGVILSHTIFCDSNIGCSESIASKAAFSIMDIVLNTNFHNRNIINFLATIKAFPFFERNYFFQSFYRLFLYHYYYHFLKQSNDSWDLNPSKG